MTTPATQPGTIALDRHAMVDVIGALTEAHDTLRALLLTTPALAGYVACTYTVGKQRSRLQAALRLASIALDEAPGVSAYAAAVPTSQADAAPEAGAGSGRALRLIVEHCMSAAATEAQMRHCSPTTQSYEALYGRALEGRLEGAAGALRAVLGAGPAPLSAGPPVGCGDGQTRALAPLAALEPVSNCAPFPQRQQPMDIVRSLVFMADQLAGQTGSGAASRLAPALLASGTPLLDQARAACLERGYSAGGLTLAPAAKPAERRQ